MSGQPWVKLWHGNLHGDAWYRLLPWEARGVYLQTLMLQANFGGFIPQSPEAIATLLSIPIHDFLPIWERVSEKFDEHPEGLANRKMLREVRQSEMRSSCAKASADKRWAIHRKAQKMGDDAMPF